MYTLNNFTYTETFFTFGLVYYKMVITGQIP